MVNVPFGHRHHHRRAIAGARPRSAWPVPIAVAGLTIAAVVGLGWLFHAAIAAYHARMTLTGLVADPRPVDLTIAGEQLAIPANMIRFAAARAGGAVDRVDLVLHWPALDGYSERLAEAFKDGSPSAPIIYATIARRDRLDDAARLDHVYQRFFVGDPVAGPAGLVGRRLSEDSGYGREIVYFMPDGPRPFVARCPTISTPEMPPTCLRDVNLGRGLTLVYRFHNDLLAAWRALDTGIRALAMGFLEPAA